MPAHLFGLLFVFLSAAIALIRMVPPEPVPANAPVELFSAERAMAHVREIAKRPHPVGSPGHDAVRDLLLTRLRELGLEPEVQKSFTTQRFFGRYSGATVENVIARVTSKSADRRALLFAAHYDAVPQSPGAGDDGSGTAALLEAARAIVQGPPLDRDVLFLFTDAEELGLLGAGVFASEHPAARDIVAAFNFDARGSKGSVSMFDTSDRPSELLRALSHVPRVQASSFVTTVAKLLPNDTDATIFKKAGIPTMSFAFADGVVNYHRATDAVDRLDPRSVQQMGDSAVALARHLGRGPTPSLEGEDVAYFTFFGSALVRMSHATVLLLAVAAALLVAGAVAFGVKRRDVRPRPLAYGAALALAALLLSGAASFLVGLGLSGAASFDRLLVRSGALGLVAVGAAGLVVWGVTTLVAKKWGARSAVLGASCLTAGLALACAVFVPGASVPFVMVALASAVPAWASLYGVTTVRAAGCAAACATTFIAVPMLYSVSIAAAARAAVPVGVLAVPFLLVATGIATSFEGRRRLVPSGVCLAIMGLGVGRVAWPLGEEVREQSTLVYGVDADRKQGFYYASAPRPWMSAAVKPELAARRAVPELTLSDAEYWVAPPEVAGHTGIVVEKSERRRLSDAFEIRSVLRAAPEARCLILWDEGRRIVDVASVKGKPVRHLVRFSPEKDEALMKRLRLSGMRDGLFFQFCGMAGEPVEVVLQTREEGDVPVRLIEVRDGLPPAPGSVPFNRAEGEIPSEESDRTLIGRTVRL